MGFSNAVQAQAMQPQEIDSVTNKELVKVAKVLKQAKTIQMEANQQLQKALGKTDMEYQRFQAIMVKKQLGQTDSLNLTEAEQKIIENLQPKLAEINAAGKQKFDELIKKEGLTQTRLQQILLVIRTKPEVANRFKKIVDEQKNVS